MSDRFTICLPITLAHEGGYVDHHKDPGGATNLGVTIGTLSGWLGHKATKAEVRALTVAAVEPIYRKNYWDVANCGAYQPGADLCALRRRGEFRRLAGNGLGEAGPGRLQCEGFRRELLRHPSRFPEAARHLVDLRQGLEPACGGRPRQGHDHGASLDGRDRSCCEGAARGRG